MSGSVGDLLDGLTRATVLAAMSPQLPDALVQEVLAEARQRGIAINLIVADLAGSWRFLNAAAEVDLLAGRLVVTVLAGAVPGGLAPYVEHLPVSLWEADRLISTGAIAIDLFLARVGRCADGSGTYGDMVGYTPAALTTACRVAFEVRPSDTRHTGTQLDLTRADLLVEA